jgi:lysophospholipase L1-like esterase
MRRIALLLFTAMLVGLPPATAHSRSSTRSVTVVGDSLTLGAAPYLRADLAGRVSYLNAVVGRHLNEGLAVLQSRRDLGMVVVVGLGTNDDPRAVTDFRRGVLEVLARKGPHCVIWVNVFRPAVNGASYSGYNATLRALSSRYPRLRVADWATLANRHSEWFGADGVHPSAEGYQARAALMARAVKHCS